MLDNIMEQIESLITFVIFTFAGHNHEDVSVPSHTVSQDPGFDRTSCQWSGPF